MVFPMKVTRLLVTALFLLCFIHPEGSAQATYTLTTAPDPQHGGMVAPNCSAGCIHDVGAVVKLFALPFSGYIFGGWGGACAGSNPSTSVTMSADRSCAAGFTSCGGQPVEIGSTGYAGLTAAYGDAGDGDIIGMQATNLQEAPNLNSAVSVTLKGGYGCGFGSNPSMTLLMGPLTISKGSVTVENLIIVGSLSAATAIPPAIPNLPEAGGFDNVVNNPAVAGDVTEELTGTTGSDRITQYGGTGAVVQTATGDAGNDWILQVCGGTSCNQTVYPGEGIDTVYQFGGPGTTSQWITIPYTEGDTGSKTYVQVGGASPNTQIAFGSTGLDRIFQYGGAASDIQDVSCNAEDDRSEQYGGDGDDTMNAQTGTGNDYAYQDGGPGRNILLVTSGDGADQIIQKGGAEADSTNCQAGDGNDSIQVEGGGGDDAIGMTMGYGDDSAVIDAGPGNDSITYDLVFGTDSVAVDGGEGTDIATVANSYGQPVVIQDSNANVIHQYGSGGSTVTLENTEFLIAYGETPSHNPNDNVAFTMTFAAGSLNSVPAGADKVTISMDASADTSVYRLTPDLVSAATLLTVSFVAVAGNHTYTAEAWSGSTLLGTIGPISFTTVSGFPLTIPLAFAFPVFGNYHTDIGEATPNTFTYFGTEARNRVVQYGGAVNDTLYVESGAGNDWIEQYGSAGDDGMLAESGTENDYIMQVGGDGNDIIKFHLGFGDDFGFQYGGVGDDNIEALGGDGSDTIYLDGGDGNDTIYAKPDAQNDVVTINGEAGNDGINYEVCTGTDSAFIDGGTGTDSLTARQNGNPVRIADSSGNTLYLYGSGGTTITVINLEHITVLDEAGNILFTWNAP